jgi:hypothetical protein
LASCGLGNQIYRAIENGGTSVPSFFLFHGSNKTNDEVVAKLLTWKWRVRKTSSSQDRQGNLSVLLHFALFMSIFARRGGAI